MGDGYISDKLKFYNMDSLSGVLSIPDESVDCIVTDPPYKYLKNQKLEVDFDEALLFRQAYRVLKPGGFIVLFGRGASFYRWNTILADLGFSFKEEIVWNKRRTTSPATPIGRVHETISLSVKGKGKVNRVKVDYFERYKYNPDKVNETINRIATTFGNRKTFDLLRRYYQDGFKQWEVDNHAGFNVTTAKGTTKSINRTIEFASALEEGVTEQSIIAEVMNQFSTIHPTQKPVKLIERLLALVSKEGDTCLDFFTGSGTTGHACLNTGRNFIGFEIDEEYYDKALNRLQSAELEMYDDLL